MTERRLAAILVADVVGYSRLIGADESGTLAQLQSLRQDVIDPTIAKHSGRLFKTVGDGFLVEFASAVQAVTCAMAIQEANTNGTLPLRIGVHLGDVLVQGDDLMGDGVNVAARIEGVAEAGGIAISRQVHDQVRDRLDVAFEDKGKVELKNIARAVHVFAIGGQKTPAVLSTPALPDKPSIAVLPFQNMSADPEKEYFSDGIAEDIITNLSKFRDFNVISRNTTFTYKGASLDIARIGHELKSDYVVEGSVRSLGARVRITAQLTDVATGAHVWAERYDRELTDVFEVQDEITARIATALDPAIRRVETKSALRRHPTNLGAWDHVLRGRWHVNQFKKDSNAEARREFEAASARDAGGAPAHAWLAMTYVFDAWFNWTETHASSLESARRAAADAASCDDAEPMSHVAIAMVCFWSSRMEQAHQASERAIALNPNSFLAHFICGGSLNYRGRCEAAVPHHLKALDLSPHDPLAWNCLGSLAHTHFNLRNYDEAVAAADRAIVLRHGYLFGRVVKVAALAHAGRLSEAQSAYQAILEIAPDFSAARLNHYPFVLDAQKLDLLNGLQAAGLSAPQTGALSGPTPALALPDKPSIAVLPFQNMSGDPEQEYFADGMVEDIITALSRTKALFVIARNSSFSYKGRSPDIRQVGRELGVRYVLEGSVRKAGNRVRITGQLIDASSGAHIWADRFEGNLQDIFELQDQVTLRVVGAISPTLLQAEIERSRRKPTGDLQAYDYYLRGIFRFYSFSKEGNDEALALFHKAIDFDPEFALALGHAALCHQQRKVWRWSTDPAEMIEAERLARRAIELDRTHPMVLALAGATLLLVAGHIEEAAVLLDKAIELDPSLFFGWNLRGWTGLGRGEKNAIDYFERALRLSPLDPRLWSAQSGIANAHFLAGRYDEASSWSAIALRQYPRIPHALRVSAASNALAGRLDDARKALEALHKIQPNMRLSNLSEWLALERDEDVKKFASGLRLAGMTE